MQVPILGSLRSAARVVSDAYSTHGIAGSVTAARYYATRLTSYLTSPGRECPLCGWTGREFRPGMLLADQYVRASAVCPQCTSWERHRSWGPALRALLDRELQGRRVDVLHFSPEECITRLLRPYAATYIGSNYLYPQPGELQLDLHALDLPDESADLVAMSYVLCCIPHDLKARDELWRVLRPGGMVIACEEIQGDRHDEWGAPRHGGQWRTYGMADAAARFSPFEVEIVALNAGTDAATRERYRVNHPQYMMVMRKTR
jgi:SAM-dependent methyltransferase